MKRYLFALLLVCLPALAQYDTYTVSYSTTLSAAGTALSVQLPTTGSHVTRVTEATVQSSAACSVRLERNGAVASGSNATAATIVALNPETTPTTLDSAQGGTPNFTAWYGANIPTGTVVIPAWSIPAGGLIPFGGGRIMSTKSGVTSNYIIRVVSPCTGTVTLYFAVEVRR